MAFPPLGNSDHVFISVSIEVAINSKQDALFHGIPYDYSCADWDGLRDHLRDVPWEDIFKIGVSAAASEFCEWVQVGIYVYITHRNYQVKPHSSPWFLAACAAALVHRSDFFCLYQQSKSSESKVKWPNLHLLLKQKSPSIPRNLALGSFGKLLIAFSMEVNLLYLLYSTVWRCCLLHLIKQNCLLKTFLRTLILTTWVYLYLFSLLELI